MKTLSKRWIIHIRLTFWKAQPQHFGTEFLDYKISIKTVSTLEEALDHIYTFSSKHSEAVVAEDEKVVDQFPRSVDAAAVYANASTAFTDGAQFGLGAEIGISTEAACQGSDGSSGNDIV